VFWNTTVPRAVLSADVTFIFLFLGNTEGEVCASPPVITFGQLNERDGWLACRAFPLCVQQ
jgi:hypothetical protein